MLLKYGDSDWYQKNVVPVSITHPSVRKVQSDSPDPQYRNKVFPPEEKTVRVRSQIHLIANVPSPLNHSGFIGTAY